jgi:hypothetical protein
MAKEVVLRKKLLKILAEDKWVAWWPGKIRFKQNDIFGIFDIVCCKKDIGELKFIQLTTVSNLAARRKKIKFFFKENKISLKKNNFGAEIEIWAWSKKNKAFKIEKI